MVNVVGGTQFRVSNKGRSVILVCRNDGYGDSDSCPNGHI